MADDKSKTNGGDRKRVAADQGYEVSYFARKHGLSTKDARALIERVGNDRSKLDSEADKIVKSSPSRRRRNGPPAAQSSKPKTPTQRTAKTPKKRTSTAAKAAALVGVVAAGALLWSRRSQLGEQISKLSDQISGSEESGLAFAGTSSERSQVPSGPQGGSSGRTQVEIAEEALTLKELGRTHSG